MTHSAFRAHRRLPNRAAHNGIGTRVMKRFADRADAGRKLASRMDFLRGHNVVVLDAATNG